MKFIAAEARRLVVKVEQPRHERRPGLDHAALARWASRSPTQEAQEGRRAVSSVPWQRVCTPGWKRRPNALHELQAAAAVGQMGLVEAYESCFRKHDLHTAQILLTHEDLADRKRYLTRVRRCERCSIWRHPGHQRKRYGGHRRDPIRRQHAGGTRHQLIEADALVILTDQPGFTPRTRDGMRRRTGRERSATATLKKWRRRGQSRRQRRNADKVLRQSGGTQRRFHHHRIGREPDVLVRLAQASNRHAADR